MSLYRKRKRATTHVSNSPSKSLICPRLKISKYRRLIKFSTNNQQSKRVFYIFHDRVFTELCRSNSAFACCLFNQFHFFRTYSDLNFKRPRWFSSRSRSRTAAPALLSLFAICLCHAFILAITRKVSIIFHLFSMSLPRDNAAQTFCRPS